MFIIKKKDFDPATRELICVSKIVAHFFLRLVSYL